MEAAIDNDEERDSDLNEAVRLLLRVTQEKVEEGSCEEALAAILHAIRLTQGKYNCFALLDIFR